MFVREQRKEHVDPEHFEKERQLSNDGLPEADARPGFAHDAQAQPVLAERLAVAILRQQRIKALIASRNPPTKTATTNSNRHKRSSTIGAHTAMKARTSSSFAAARRPKETGISGTAAR